MDIEDIKRKMLIKYPFFGSVTTNVKYEKNTNIETAGTDGQTVFYNPEYLNSLSESQKTFLFAHEISHIAFDHILRSEGKDKDLWNIATDAVINALLRKDGLDMINGGVDIPEAINYDAEKLYEKLLKEQENKKESSEKENNQNENSSSNNNSNQNNSSDQENSSDIKENKDNQKFNNEQKNNQNNDNVSSPNNKDVGHDTHSMWEDAVRKNNEKKEEAKFEENESDNKENEKHNKINEMSNMGEKKAFKKNKEEKKKELEKLRESLSKVAIGAGDNTNSEKFEISDIGKTKPLIDWRYTLKEATKHEVDWSYVNAEVENGVVTPYLEEIPIPETEILLDTSGSISEVLLKNFLRECKSILETSKVKVGCFDTEFYGFHEIKNDYDIDELEIVGRGGTNFNSAVNAFSRRVENKIIFTDGDAYMPDKSLDVIWVVFGGMNINPSGGKVINITDEQLRKLSSSNSNYYNQGRRR